MHENNYTVQNAVDDVIYQDNNKLCVEDESQDNIDSEIDKNDLNNIDRMSLDENK